MRLKAKVILFFLVLAFISGSLIIGLTWRTVRGSEMKMLIETGLDKATALADVITLKDMQSEALLLPLLQAEQKVSLDSDYVAVLDNEGRVVAHTNVGETGILYKDPLTLRTLQDNHPGTQLVKRAHETYLEVWAPIGVKQSDTSNEQFLFGGDATPGQSHRLGTVRLDLPLRDSLKTQSRIIREISVIVVIIGSIAFLFTLGLMNKLLIPIELLAQGTSRIAQGQYGIEVPVTSHDELGRLADDFNRMSKVLAGTTVSKDFLSNILDNLLDPLLVLNPDTTIQIFNPAATQLLGYTKEEILGKLLHVLTPAGENLFYGEQESSLRKATLKNVELKLAAKNGSGVAVLFSSTVIKDGTGKITHIIAIAKDMTERKKLEIQLLQTGKLSAVGQLAGGVAHEINNPLGVILGFAQGMLRRVSPGDVFELPLKAVEREAIRCKNLVQDLLTFSRTSKVDREPMDLNQAIEGALSLVTAQARLGQIQVQKDLSKNLPRIFGNPNQVQQVIINLANNALDAMGKQGTLTLRTESLEGTPRSWACLYVTDTGSGIPADILSRIFEPFFTTKPLGQGTGLGLGLVHEIVQKHSGTIEVQSRPGHTEFCVKFPVRLPQGKEAFHPIAR